MEPKEEVGLAVFVGMVVVWLIYGSARVFQKKEGIPARDEFSHVFGFRRDMRILGAFIGISSVGLLLFFSVAISPDDLKPGDWLIALVLSGFMGGVGGVTGAMLWRGRIYLGEKGVLGWSAFGLPVFIEWYKLNGLEFSGGMQSYKLVGNQKTAYVPALLNDYENFLELVRAYAPKAEFESNISINPEKLVEDRYLESMEKNSSKWAAFFGIIVLLSFYFLSPLYSSILISFIAGACLFSEMFYMKVVVNNSAKVRKLLQFLGLFLFIILANISLSRYEAHIGGEDNIDGYMWFPLMVQTTVSAIFFGFLLLVIINKMFSGRKMPNKSN